MRRGLSAIAFLAIAVGCQNESLPPTYRASGTITFKGQPIPSGSITFGPDGRKGNTGPTGVAVIKDGKYDTGVPGGRGVGPGPQNIQVDGFDGAKLICQHYLSIDFPAKDSVHDMDIPASAAPSPAANGVVPP